MATYKQIGQFVREKYGFVPKPCWVAHVMSGYGLTKRIASNRISVKTRKYPCPDSKRQYIEAALKHFRMI